ncbi:MAG: hypothetical protein V4760_01680 [Bdellovibrionota bacterium]
MIRRSIALLSLLTLAPSAFGASQVLVEYTALQETFVAREWNHLNCVYGSILVKKGIIDEKTRLASFQPLSAESCARASLSLNEILENPSWQRPTSTPNFPNYLQMSQGLVSLRAEALRATGLPLVLQAPTKRESLKAVSVDLWSLENKLRATLKVEDGHPTKTDCSWKTDTTASLAEARNHLYDRLFWHAELFDQGYDCTISRFKGASWNLNAEKNFPWAQSLFESERAQIAKIPHKQLGSSTLKGLHIAVFPQLAYDAPTPLEKLTYKKLKKDIEKLGGTLDVVHRISSSSAQRQIADSANAFAKIAAKYPRSKLLVMTRSMGGMVAREVLERFPNLRARVSGVVEIGSTPFGSVIADYKARGDAFDGNYIERNDWKEIAAINTIGWVKPEFRELHFEALKRNNIASMSFRLYDPAASSRKNLDLPVVNVIQLPDSLGTYFRYKETVKVDPAMLLMSMYGPVEGSSPLTHSAWDTAKSVRLFTSDFNHLGFWGLAPDLATDYTIAILKTAKRIGAW